MKTSQVPPFDAGKHALRKVEYVWWNWHPHYPYWSRSCWKADSIKKAIKVLTDVRELRFYHNKLIREDGVNYEEVLDEPCQEMELWEQAVMAIKGK